MRLMRDLVGDTLSDRYRLISRIAGGGMGEVYRGHDLLLDRSVAVKVLQPSLAADPELVARFKEEARAAARLSHPNVVAVHDWGSADENTYYMVMEYVAGTDLRDILVGKGPLDPAHAAEIAVSICEGLAAAHRTGLVHRDVKPENVLIARDGTVKVADFGIAAVVDAERTVPGGTILGTLRYLSPEQAAGKEAGFLSDVWGVGAVLFELLTGTSPQGGSGAELLRRRAVEPSVAPSAIEPLVPGVLDEIVLKACAVDPSDRYADALEMAADLRVAASGIDTVRPSMKELFVDLTGEISLPDMAPTGFVTGRRSSRRRRRASLPKIALVLFVIAGLGFGGLKAAAALMAPKEVDVPRVTGRPLQEAITMAEGSGLVVEVVGRERDASIPEGSIISQDPLSGVLVEGDALEVVVSKGLPLAKLPDLVGKELAAVEAKLAALNLAVGGIEKDFSSKFEAGVVMGQSIAPGKVQWGKTIALVVSKGPEDLEVPGVVGLKVEKAEEALVAAGFVPVRIDVYSDEVPEGKVVYIDPAVEVAPDGSEITIAISIGPEFKEITMPDVRLMSVDDATAKLEGMGLQVNVRRSCPGST
ncbi:MAG: PASTA domain-containing protein, partial [Actinobacteria bacterium]|nr:PASTA domain-containing protein [Actinomycetota bacterium]